MPQKKNFFPVFLGLFVFSLILFFLSRGGILAGVSGFLEHSTLPLQQLTFNVFHSQKDNNTENARLRNENSKLTAQLVDKIQLERENQALRDQFQTPNPKSSILLPAKIVGMIGQEIIIDKGKNDGAKVGSVVVSENNLVGKVVKVSEHICVVKLITHGENLTAKTAKTGAVGIAKTQGGNIILDNVVLTDKLEKDDFVLTKGDIEGQGQGFPPDLVIGKIITVAKKSSNLFQSAKVLSLVDFSRLEMVFVMIE